jgi:hypothetical protein
MIKLIMFIISLVILNNLFKIHNTTNEIDQAIYDELKIIK